MVKGAGSPFTVAVAVLQRVVRAGKPSARFYFPSQREEPSPGIEIQSIVRLEPPVGVQVNDGSVDAKRVFPALVEDCPLLDVGLRFRARFTRLFPAGRDQRRGMQDDALIVLQRSRRKLISLGRTAESKMPRRSRKVPAMLKTKLLFDRKQAGAVFLPSQEIPNHATQEQPEQGSVDT